MKNLCAAVLAGFLIIGCSTRAKLADKPLPRPAPPAAVESPKKLTVTDPEAEELKALRERIMQVSERVICSKAADWRVAAAGAKPCGGPSFYVAYHRSAEIEIRPLLEEYTVKQDAYNKMHGLVSDCMLIAPPQGIKCEKGKAVLVQNGAGSSPAF